MNAPADIARFGSGHAVRRVEDPALVQGQGRFTDDVSLPGQTWLAFVRSDRAHARIVAIDRTEAAAVPGVLAIYTGADLVAAGVKPIALPANFKRPDGQPAGSTAQARVGARVRALRRRAGGGRGGREPRCRRAAAALVMVDYEDLPAVGDPVRAMQPGAPVLWPAAPDNVAAEMRHGDAAATDAAFAGAACRIALDIVNQRLAPVTMEPRSVLAYLDGDRLTLRMSSQMPSGVRTGLAATHPRPHGGQRARAGGRCRRRLRHEDRHLPRRHRARLGRPATGPTGEVAGRARRGVPVRRARPRPGQPRRDWRWMPVAACSALRVRTLANVGAYPSGTSIAIPLLVGPWVSTSIYDIPAVEPAPHRGADERRAHRRLPRRRPARGHLPHRAPDGRRGARARARPGRTAPAQHDPPRADALHATPWRRPTTAASFEQILDQGLALADWHGFAARRAASQARGKLRGRGIATFLEWTGGNALEENVRSTSPPTASSS